jgi:hypothetical protein
VDVKIRNRESGCEVLNLATSRGHREGSNLKKSDIIQKDLFTHLLKSLSSESISGSQFYRTRFLKIA